MEDRTHYDPLDRLIYVSERNNSRYALYHEEAHRDQHAKQTLIFRFWWKVCNVRFIEYFATLLIEFDAYRRARRRMIEEGCWTPNFAEEARRDLLSYLKREELTHANVVR